MSGKLRLALLISGGGTTMREILTASRDGRLSDIDPVCVIASRPTAGGIEKARAWGMGQNNIIVVSPRDFPSAEDFGDALVAMCEQRGVNLIGQYGWLPRTPLKVISRYQGLMINQHPGPLDTGRPDFGGKGMYGRRVHAARLYFVRRVRRDYWTEATAQLVHPEFDRGAVIGREQVPILPADDPTSLQERVLPAEHRVQIAALRSFCEVQVAPLSRNTPLVRDGEESILSTAKEIAATLFPKG